MVAMGFPGRWIVTLAVVCGAGLAAPSVQAQSSSLPANWQQLGQADLAALCESWIPVTAAASQADKAQLAQQAWSAWLNDPTKAAALTPDQFITLSTLAASKLANAECELLAKVLLRRFPTNADAQPLSLTSLERLSGPLAQRLALKPDQVSGWLASWVEGHQNGGDLALAEAARAWDLCELHKSSPAVLQGLVQSMWSRFLQAPAGWDALADAEVMRYYHRLFGSLPPASQAPLCQNVWRRLNTHVPQMVQALVMRDFRRIEKEIIPRAQVPMRNLVPLLAGFVEARGSQCTLGELGFGVFVAAPYRRDEQLEGTVATVYQTVAGITVNQLTAPAPVADFDDYYNAPQLGRVFETDADRQRLAGLLGAGVLENRLAAAQILTWSYHAAGKLGDWQTQVAARLADPASDADTKAFWRIVSGSIDQAKYLGGEPGQEPQIWRKRQWLDQALAAASGEPMRLVVLQEFANYFRTVRRPGDGASLLASVSGQFTPAAAAKLKVLRQTLQNAQSAQDLQFQEAQAAALKASQAAQLKDYQASLIRAQMDRNPAAVTQLQAAIANLQAQMQQTGP